MLLRLGAKKVMLNDESGRMLKGIYAGVIDTVGGHMLETVLKRKVWRVRNDMR